MVLRNEPPWPLCHGGRLHTYELCRRLARRHDVLVVAEHPGEGDVPPLPFACRAARAHRLFDDDPGLAEEGIRLSRSERFFGIEASYVRDVSRLAREWRAEVVIGMSYQALSCLSRIRGVPTIADLQDDEVLHLLRECLHGRTTGRWTNLKGLLSTLFYQRAHLAGITAVTMLSEGDRRFCRWYTGHPRIVCIPHGVDCERYAPRDAPVDENLIAFWGGLTFDPNINAILFFADRVWPIVRRHRPQARWSIIGWGDSPHLTRIRQMPGVEFRGFVEDLRPEIARAAVAIVPMLTGTGIKNKIMEAWAMGKPVLCTRRALGNLPGTHGENVWLADSPRDLADGLIELLDMPALRLKIGRSARATAIEHCSWDQAARQLEQLCDDLAHPVADRRFGGRLDRAYPQAAECPSA